MQTINNYIYLLREREFIRMEENIYKIGKTTQFSLKRFNSYPSGSELILHIKCINCHESERILIDLFKLKYKQRKDIGLEYFEGDSTLMMNDVILCVAPNVSNNIIFPYLNKIITIVENTNNKLENMIEVNDVKTDILHSEHVSLRFLKYFIEDTFRGKTFFDTDTPKDTYGYRFDSSSVVKRYREYAKLTNDSDESLSRYWKALGIVYKQMRIVRKGKISTGFILFPPDIRRILEKKTKIDGFQFNDIEIKPEENTSATWRPTLL